MNKNPEFSGVLQDNAKDFKQRKTIAKIALWRNESSAKNAPVYRGVLKTDKGEFRITLWKFEPKEEGEKSPFSPIHQ